MGRDTTPITLRWIDIFPTFESFQESLTTFLSPYLSGGEYIAEWLDEQYMFSPFTVLYFHLTATYSNRLIRYSMDNWLLLFWSQFVESAFGLYFKQQAFVNKELNIIRDYTLRDKEHLETSTGESQQDNAESPDTFGGKAVPLTPTDDVAERAQTKDNFSQEKKIDNYNIIKDLKMLFNNRFDIGMSEFVNTFNNLFIIYNSYSINQQFYI